MKRKQVALLLSMSLLAGSAGAFLAEDLAGDAVTEDAPGADFSDELDLGGDVAIADSGAVDTGEADSQEIQDSREETESVSEEELAQEDILGLIEDTGKIKTDSVPETEAVVIPGFYVDPTQYPAANMTVNTSFAYFYLRNKLELNHAAASGVLANMQLESNFRPIALGDGGTSYGVCQWHLDRFSNLIYFCNSRGLDYNTLTGQLEYLNYELTHGYASVLAYLENVEDTAQGAYDAAYIFCMYFESPDQTQARSMQRGNLAQNEYYGKTFDTEDDKQIEKDVRSFVAGVKTGNTDKISLITSSLLMTNMMPVSSYMEETLPETETEPKAQTREGQEPLTEEDTESVTEGLTEGEPLQ